MEGAIRETREEANVDVEVISPFAQLDIPLIGQYVEDMKEGGKPKFHYVTIIKSILSFLSYFDSVLHFLSRSLPTFL
ncbi:hypothetical protein JHK87_004306 [Glycine soja]|nr:hypothetical protein JHK87_004306 [Glycine soja]